MGLFSPRRHEPLEYAPVERIVHVPADRDAVIAHLVAYSGLWSPKRAEQHRVLVGEAGDWIAIRLPDAVHPWQLHNLAFWMLECTGRDTTDAVTAESASGPDHPAYRLVADPEIADALCGWDEQGDGWTVWVPDNSIVRGEDVPMPRALTVPRGHRDWREVPVLFEDPGRGMNDRNAPTARNRRSLIEPSHVVF